MFRIMSMTLRNINPQKEIFHHYDFPVYTTSKYRDRKLDTYRRITHMCGTCICDYLKHSIFRFNLLNFQLNTDFPSQFFVFYRKIT